MKRLEKIISSVFLFLIGIVCSLEVSAQNRLQWITATVKKDAQNRIVEKVYVHTDKSHYVSGEILWLKVYGINRETNTPLDLSRICYIELLDTANHPVYQAKIAMQNAVGNGSIYLPQSINSGAYRLRAYTRFMKSLDPSGFFEKKITIVNLNKLVLNPKTADSSVVWEISFFPEGGNLVSGLENNVAYKVFSKNGLKDKVAGYLICDADTLKRFEPSVSGVGAFQFIPAHNKNYRAVLINNGQVVLNKELPAASGGGVALQVADMNDSYRVDLFSNGGNMFYSMIHSRGVIRNSNSIKIQNGSARFEIEKKELPEGISTLTIFDESGIPVAERLLFRYPSKDLALNLSASKQGFNSREQVDIRISSTTLKQADSAFLSMSVFRIDSLQTVPSIDIRSYLLLSSELRGTIDNPSLYVMENDEKSKSALNLLLLTQGWRRFNTGSILSRNAAPTSIPELQGHLVTGRVVDKLTKRPAEGVVVYISAPSPVTIFKTAVSDSAGFFKADLQNYYGAKHLVAQTQLNNYDITIDNPFSVAYQQPMYPLAQYSLNYPQTILKQNLGSEVQNVFAADLIQRVALPSFADTLSFYEKPDISYRLDRYTRFATMEETIREFISLVDVRTKNKEFDLRMVNTLKKEYFSNPPLNLVDGVPTFNFTKFFETDPAKISSVDLITQQYVLGNSVFDGVLNWKTYKPSLDNFKFDPQVLVLNYESLQLQREFYSPVYESAEQRSSHFPDFRNVLQWMPDIMLKSGSISTSFYTSDLPGRYAVVVEGLSSSGIPGVATAFFEVK